ncbi:MAG TPA: SiaB family protein kinase, partial [Tenuifilaceae bacterium]|nr:SiaB family protein kinase [Tenuifilaceae bacterium]
FMVSKGDAEYHVTTGNIIENSKIEELSQILDNINNLDKEGLKELYKTQMREGRLSEKGGAGLGFIDIARKTGRKLDYHFLPIDEDTHFFVLTSTISRTE